MIETSLKKLCITAALLLQVDDHAQQRLQGLTELYNVADDAKTQHMLLRQAIAYAIKANLANLLGPVIKVNKRMYIQLTHILCVCVCTHTCILTHLCLQGLLLL